MPINNLEKYLVEPSEFIGGVETAENQMKEYTEKINLYKGLEQQTAGLVASVKNPQSHTAAGVLGLIESYEKTLKDYTEKREVVLKDVEDGYSIRVGDENLAITKDDIKIWDYRMAIAEKFLGYLREMYRPDIKTYLGEQAKKNKEQMAKIAG